MIVTAISRCLETIIPDTNFPKKLPPSMSNKLKITSSLAAQIKDLGYRDDIGYQTILYCNEAEIRRIFMFLIEKLPRESSKTTHVEQTGYIPTLVKDIEHTVKKSLQQFWVPSSVLRNGCRKSDNIYIFNSLGNSRPLCTKKLKVPSSSKVYNNETLKQYWVHNVPAVTKQCSSKELLPSLLFEDSFISSEDISLRKCLKIASRPTDLLLQSSELVQATTKAESVKITEMTESETENKLKSLLEELNLRKNKCLELEDAVKSCETQLKLAIKTKTEDEEILQNTLAQVSLKSKTLTVISKEENLQKLKHMIEASKNKLLNLTEQWNQIQTPLLEEYKSLQNAISHKDLKRQQEQEKLRKLEETQKTLKIDLNEKTQLEEELRKKLQQINKTHNRSGYTRRILEIIGNIKKQDDEIQKILNDTKMVQREISNLTGQVDRSFTLADELIFRDAKQDETARRAYKLLAQLRDDCSSIIKAVTDLGAVERECRNLQEQIDSETGKESAVKLERVNKDLQEMRKETEQLLKQR
ncbi:Coiled-coil domain-containing protein 22 homolog-like Protein [Tribolium castaneum]|uniref:Coiled-coil domain-containing protein 22 homolog n=1 Tax=Tribolium castaneum TaxID=7070 RepID=D2A268_TRICA|nr:Coiled-coil domain-containing protein 22 homolog-like Protein [Tribolium castaneum]